MERTIPQLGNGRIRIRHETIAPRKEGAGRMGKVSVAIVEDDDDFRQEVGHVLADSLFVELTGLYATGQDALQGIMHTRPEVALVDLELPDLSGIEVIRRTANEGGTTECLVLSCYDDDDHLFDALQAGAVGYIVKHDASRSGIVKAIQEVRDGGAPMSAGIARRIIQKFQVPRRNTAELEEDNGLSPREQEILAYRMKGFSARETGKALYIGYETVRFYQKSIYRKLQVHSIMAAAAKVRGARG